MVTQYFWPESFRINDLCIQLERKGHAITVLTGQPNYPSGRFYPGHGALGPVHQCHEGIDIARVPVIPRGRGGAIRLVFNYASFAVAALTLGPWLCRKDIDLILVFEPSPITVALPALLMRKLRRVPLFMWVQDLWPESLSATGSVTSPWVLRQVERLVAFIYRRCDRVLVQSQAFAPSVARLGGRPNSIEYFPNTAEDFYHPIEVQSDAIENAEMPKGFRVVFAGNLGAAQDLGVLVDAAEHLQSYSDVQWIVFGDGRRRQWLSEQISKRGLTHCVHLLGTKPPGAMPRYFALADVLLVTLKREPIFSLTIPSKLQSYLACGKPVVAALEGEGARLIRDSCAGVAVNPEDSRALADAVLRIRALGPGERSRMGRMGRSYFERHFDRDMLVCKLEDWMRQSVEERRCAS